MCQVEECGMMLYSTSCLYFSTWSRNHLETVLEGMPATPVSYLMGLTAPTSLTQVLPLLSITTADLSKDISDRALQQQESNKRKKWCDLLPPRSVCCSNKQQNHLKPSPHPGYHFWLKIRPPSFLREFFQISNITPFIQNIFCKFWILWKVVHFIIWKPTKWSHKVTRDIKS